ncbi:kynureninase [Angomonas deanei]|nr:kynureninase [Angomonas deanei]CAD2221303.1 Aminotransferase class-V/Cys/Met metabolism PLP-dependent enzyme, putative [Angomonas deanei]|eukprot:EPY40198.1 kynureninase [Angomonas deanei]
MASSVGLSLTDDAFAEHRDEIDVLNEHRQSYHFPKQPSGAPFIYLVGNSLGLQHVGVRTAVDEFLQKWQDQAVEGHFMQPNPWFEIDEILRADMAKIVGADRREVVLMNTLTVNIHFMMAAFYRPEGKRKKILMENQGFPSDTHALISQLQLHGYGPEDLITVSAPGHEEVTAPVSPVTTEAFIAAIEQHADEIAIVMITAIHFLTGQLFDIPAIVKAAHAHNIVVGVDCAHAVGNVPLQLHDWDVDFACWCTYKYLNSGPGNVGGAFVHSKHTDGHSNLTYLKGWWGHDRKSRFSLHREFEPADGAACFQCSTAPTSSLTILQPSLQLMASIGMPKLREKSLHLTAYMELLLHELVPAGCIESVTPADPEQRGAQLSIRILPGKLKTTASSTAGYECGVAGEGSCDADIAQRQLLDCGVMVDNRPPDIIRLAPAPLYNSYMDVLQAVRVFASLFE